MTKTQAFIDGLMAEMTLAEKIGQLNLATPGGSTATGATVNSDVGAKIVAGRIGSVFGIKTAEATRIFQELALKSRLGIPLMFAEDVIHGQNTIFPIPLGLAASWNVALIETSARVAAIEASAIGIDQAYGPMVDVCRDARWGRIAESPGEDPFLASAYAAAMVRGYQGDGLDRPNSVMACLKHYAAYGAPSGGRDYDDAEIAPATFHDVYLPPFAAGVKAGAGSVMAAFLAVDGVPMHANRTLIDGLLRNRLGFGGLVVADYTGIQELIAHGVAGDRAEAAEKAIAAGVDLDMVSEAYLDTLEAAVAAGRVDPALIDTACRRVLEAKNALGLFDDPFHRLDWGRSTMEVLTASHRAAARKAVAESAVLLKNDDRLLPLAKAGTIALIGPLADDRVNMNGTWAVSGSPATVVPILTGLQEAAGAAVRVLNAKGANIVDDKILAARLNVHDGAELSVVVDKRTPDEMIAEALVAAMAADVVVAVVGEAREYSGESSSRTDLTLPEPQKKLLRALKTTGKPLVVVVMTGRPLALPEEARLADALLVAWFGGTEIGHGLADVLFGTVSPGGRLPATFPYAGGQEPLTYAHRPTGRPWPGHYQKFTSGYLDVPDDQPPNDGLFPFGFGLSYGDVVYGPPRVDRGELSGPDDRLTVSVSVTNLADREAPEVVQLYVGDPVASLSRPVKELKGFEKIVLAPREKRTVTFTLTAADLSFSTATDFIDTRRTFEPGAFDISVGANSRDHGTVRITWSLPEETTASR